MLLSRILRGLGLVHLILGALVATVVVTEPKVRRYGDNLQIALPLLAWGCAATGGEAREFAIRFAVLFTTAHASKNVLGDAAVNLRPNGSDGGFPSAHTAAATLGASALAHGCLQGNPAAQAVVVIAAAFVGGTRIEVGAHTIWQVLAGALLGWGSDRALRSGPLRARVIAAARALGRATARRMRPLFAFRPLSPGRPRMSLALRAAAVAALCLIGAMAFPMLA